MDARYRIRRWTPDDTPGLLAMVLSAFDAFVAPGYPPEGVKEFRGFAETETLNGLLLAGTHEGYACFEGEAPVGAILLRGNDHVSLLFVDEAHHRRGIARELYGRGLEACKARNPFLCEVTVKSSPYAVEAYRRLGFEPTGPQASENGILYTPMSHRFRGEMELREMTIGEYGPVSALWHATKGIGLSAADGREELGRFLEQNPGLCFTAWKEGAVVATILCGSDERRGYVYHAAVEEGSRGRGVGSVMAARVLAALKARGVDRCHLFAMRDNEIGQAFWSSTGWRRRDDLVVFTRDID
jgi:ribosomal protein S18 acetylase RimI-like enzyme